MKTHNIALAFDTTSAGNIQVWIDGAEVFNKGGLSFWTGDTYPKFGIYRGEKGDRDGSKHSNVFDMWLYRLQISDSSLDEISEASGLAGQVGGGNSTTVPRLGKRTFSRVVRQRTKARL